MNELRHHRAAAATFAALLAGTTFPAIGADLDDSRFAVNEPAHKSGFYIGVFGGVQFQDGLSVDPIQRTVPNEDPEFRKFADEVAEASDLVNLARDLLEAKSAVKEAAAGGDAAPAALTDEVDRLKAELGERSEAISALVAEATDAAPDSPTPADQAVLDTVERIANLASAQATFAADPTTENGAAVKAAHQAVDNNLDGDLAILKDEASDLKDTRELAEKTARDSDLCGPQSASPGITCAEFTASKPGFTVPGADVVDPVNLIQTLRAAAEGDSDVGARFGVSIGHRFNDIVRVEAEASYSFNDSDASAQTFDEDGQFAGDVDLGGNIGIFSLFANGWIDIPIDAHIRPYIGGGVGVAFLSGAGIDSDEKFTYQVGAGLTVPVSGSVDLSAGYRFQQVLDVEVDGSDAGDITNHLAEIGLRFNF